MVRSWFRSRITDSTVEIPSSCPPTGARRCGSAAIHVPGFDSSSRISTVAARRQQHGVLPGQVLVRHAVHRQHQEALAVKVDRVLHRVEAPRSFTSRIRTGSPRRKRQSMSMFSRPVAGSRRIHRTCRPRRGPVHHRHRAAPLDRREVDRVELHQPLGDGGRSRVSSVRTSAFCRAPSARRRKRSISAGGRRVRAQRVEAPRQVALARARRRPSPCPSVSVSAKNRP